MSATLRVRMKNDNQTARTQLQMPCRDTRSSGSTHFTDETGGINPTPRNEFPTSAKLFPQNCETGSPKLRINTPPTKGSPSVPYRPGTALGRMTPTGPGPKSSRAAGWRRSWTSRSFKPHRMSCPWLSPRATRSKAYVSGLPVGACRRIGRACIRGRRVVERGCGGWCERSKSSVKTQRGAGP